MSRDSQMRFSARGPRAGAAATAARRRRRALALCVAAGLLAVPAGAGLVVAADERDPAEDAPIIDHQVRTIDGEPISLDRYRGKALLIVNTASRCGFTPQYEGLEALYQRFRDRGLVVVGFPSNDFGNQEPGSNEQIKSFCERNYGVSFPMMAKLSTRGDGQAPLYRTLTQRTPEPLRGEIRWNFTKFLVDPEGRVVERFEPRTEPLSEEIVSAVKRTLPGGGN